MNRILVSYKKILKYTPIEGVKYHPYTRTLSYLFP